MVPRRGYANLREARNREEFGVRQKKSLASH
jgi:hypothetical protein